MAASIPSNSITKFAMATPPVGWTQVTTYDDYALRVTSGTAGTNPGYGAGYTSVFVSKTAYSTTQSISIAAAPTAAPSPSHTHPGGAGAAYTRYASVASTAPGTQTGASPLVIWPGFPGATSPAGSGAGHSHTVPLPSGITSPFIAGATLDFSIRYIDVIIAQRN